MPSDDRDQTSPQADRLSRKIDRLQSGQPAPVLDGDTEDLAELARLLMTHLDPEQPDPEFRAQLKQDLIAPSPRLVTFRRRPGPRRYPVPALFSALTVVLVASAVTGWMAFGDQLGSNDDSNSQFARFAAASPTASASVGALAVATGVATNAAAAATATSSTVDTGVAGAADAPEGESAVPPDSPDPAGSDADTASETAEPEGPEVRAAVVELPPVDSSHVELGALATVAAPSDAARTDLRLSTAVDPADIELDAHGRAYEFSAPYIDASLMLGGVRDFLGVEAQIDKRERGGKTVYSLTSPEGSVNFTWTPESGAFSCTLPDPHSISEIEDLSEAAIQWLRAFGYPVESNARAVIRTMDDGQRFIDVPLGDSPGLPNPAIGHPMSITLVLDAEGRIVSVSGYWLEVTRETDVPLVSAAQAWRAVQAGNGYWPNVTEPRGAGEFVAEDFAVSYMLTSDGGTNQDLALQPVIAISGTFTPDDGSAPYATTVYVKGQFSES